MVGVVSNLHENRLDPELVEPRIFLPMETNEESVINGVVRTAGGDTGGLVGRLRGHLVELDPDLQARVVPLASLYEQERFAMQLAALVLALLVLAVLGLSSAGIYAMMSFTVSRRQRELAIRTALGARPGLLMRGVFSVVARRIGVGVTIGMAAALGLDRLAGGELLHGFGGLLMTAMVCLVGAVAFVAGMGPARRGLRIAPREVLSGD